MKNGCKYYRKRGVNLRTGISYLRMGPRGQLLCVPRKVVWSWLHELLNRVAARLQKIFKLLQ